MSDPALSDIDIKNKMNGVLATFNGSFGYDFKIEGTKKKKSAIA